jgi:two-component system chemotaxis sensor kinase CheA
VDLSRYQDLFVAEAFEHLAAAREIAGRPGGFAGPSAPLRDLLRHTHSVKGMAASMGFAPMAALAHAMEDLLAACRDTDRGLDGDQATLIVEGLACLERMVRRAEERAPVQDPDAADLSRRLAATLSVTAAPCAAGGAAAGGVAPARRQFAVEISLSPGAPSPPLQAAMVLGRLGKHGRLLGSDPPAAALRLGRIAGRLTAHIETAGTEESLENELHEMADVESFRIERLDPATHSPAAGALPVSWTRVRSDLLDRLAEQMLDLMFEQGRLSPAVGESHDRDAVERLGRCRTLARALHADVAEMRLVPFESLAQRLSGSVEDLARRLKKPIRLDIEGRSVRLDRTMLEALADPLLHMLRNAVDHGIESAEERAAAGKEPSGRVKLALQRRTERIVITLEDDGRGLDAATLRRTAVERGILSPTEAARLGEDESLMLATLPGLSTAQILTEVSGRGVGLDAARAAIEALGGRLEIRSAAGRGAQMRMLLPLTLALVPALLVRSRGQLFALPASGIERMLDLPPAGATTESSPLVVRLDERLGLPHGTKAATDTGPALLCPAGERLLALIVDEVLGQKELVVKPLRSPLGLLKEYSGAALLEDGSIVLVLDPPALVA